MGHTAKETVHLRPDLAQRIWVFLFVTIGVSGIVLGGFSLFWLVKGSPPVSFRCTRATQRCDQTWPSPLATTTTTFALAKLHHSRIYWSGGQATWAVDNGPARIDLAYPSSDDDRVAEYRRLAADFEAFLTDPAKPTFAASYPGVSAALWWMLFVGLGSGWIGGKLWRGWSTAVVFDPAAHTLTVMRRPRLFTGPPRRTFPAGEVTLSTNGRKRVNVGRGVKLDHMHITMEHRGETVVDHLIPYATKRGKTHVDATIAKLRSFRG
jgi:hypothetical protein